jgi:xanthine dehydrogenase accessory factor
VKFWKHLLTKLQDNRKVYLLTVVDNHGSSPGRKGFKILVSDDGFIFGSIGGGVMEHSLVEEVKTLFSDENQSIFLRKQIHKGKIKDGSGMICSGEQTIVFHPLNSKHISIIENILESFQQNKTGTLCLSPTTFSFSNEEMKKQYNYVFDSSNDWSFKEYLSFKNTLYIVGGGHVGLAVSDLFINLDFHVVVFDNREGLNTFELNTSAHQKSIINYNQIDDYITQGNTSYIVIMTNTYIDDKLVLSKLLRNQYRYIGVLGSKAKLETMWEVLQKDGFTFEELTKVNAPIGLSIKSQTPEEIAVSIAAKIVQLKNANK